MADMIRKQEVAWLDANDMPVHGDSDYEESDENEPDAEVSCLQGGRLVSGCFKRCLMQRWLACEVVRRL